MVAADSRLPRGERLVRRGAVTIVACWILGCVAAGPAVADSQYSVGIGSRSINPTDAEIATGKVYLGGYGFGSPPASEGRPATGVLGEGSTVRAFSVSDGTGAAWAIADMEVQGWFVATKDGPYGLVDMRREVEKRTRGGLSAEQVIIQSDHSHSGPDGMGVWGGLPLEYRKRIFERTVEAIVESFETRRPGSLWYGRAKGNPDSPTLAEPHLLNNQFSTDPNNQSQDDDVRVLQARDADGNAFATMLNFSAHATVLGGSNTKVSGDWIQRANPLLESRFGGRAMTVVGTLGRSQPDRPGCADVTKTGDSKSLCELDAYAQRVVDRAQKAVDNAAEITGDPIVAARSYLIQDPATNGLLLGVGAVGDPAGIPLYRSILPPWLTGNVIGTVTASARIGDVLLSSVPGEIYPQIALKVRDVVSGDPQTGGRGPRGFMTAGLANDQLGYLIAPFPDAYGQPICATLLANCDFDQVGPPEPEPLSNDNYFFNVSHTMGERVTCSLLRGAGEIFGKGLQYRNAYEKCLAFANDLAFQDGTDAGKSPAVAPGAGGGVTTGSGESGQVKAGVAVVDATWHVGASSGQYAHQREPDEEFDPSQLAVTKKPSYGFQARLQARAIVVEGSDGKRMALVKNDLYIPQDLLYRRTAQILEEHGTSGIGRSNLTMAVTHDHSSPYYSSTAPGAWTFQDVYDVRFYDYYAKQMAKAVEQAASELKPVRVGASVGRTDKAHRHSFGPAIADDGTPAGYPNSDADHDLTVVRFDDITNPDKPKPLAILMNYSLHPEFLNGNELISPDYVGPLQRMVDRASGAVTIFTQSSVGTAEPERSTYHSIHERLEFTHKEYAQAEYGARLIADETLDTWRDVANGTPELLDRFVPFKQAFPVAMTDRWYPGPASHPYPGVSSCRSEPALAGDPRVPVLGLPDCQNGQGVLDGTADFFGQDNPIRLPKPPIDPGLTPQDFKDRGIPIPDNYSAPSYGVLQEDVDVHLQAFRLGDILFTICSCEQWADQARNIKSRTDTQQNNQYFGFEWADRCTPNSDGPHPADGTGTGTWTCPDPRNESASLPAISNEKFRRMEAQVANDARGWDFLENAPIAESEPTDATQIKGNYTHEELGRDLGYKLTVPVSMANDYNGYIATYREYQRGDHYRKALTAWGPHSSDYLATRLVQLGGHLKQPDAAVLPTEPQRELADTVGRPKTEADLASNDAKAEMLGNVGEESVAAYEATLPDDGGDAEVLEQPKPVERFAAAFFRWNGGSNYTDNPVVAVERQGADGAWDPYADQSGEIVTTLKFPQGEDTASYRQGDQRWEWTAHFETPVSSFDTGERPRATPAGTYRFVVDGERRKGGVKPYHLESQPFAVSPWSGITVEDLRVDDGGSVSFRVGPRHSFPVPGGNPATAEIGPIDYPDSYTSTSAARFIKNQRTVIRDPGDPSNPAKFEWFCLTCSFRPWIDAGDADTALVTIVHADGTTEQVPATQRAGRWVTTRSLAGGEAAVVGRGCVKDVYGNYNGAASTAIGASGLPATGDCPVTPPVDPPAGGGSDGGGTTDGGGTAGGGGAPGGDAGAPAGGSPGGGGQAGGGDIGGTGAPGGGGGSTGGPLGPCGNEIRGTRRADVLRGGGLSDSLLGLGGVDRLFGRDANDCLRGGGGNDVLSGGPGADRMRGDSGNDRLSGGTGNDRLAGDAGNDRLVGGRGRNSYAAGVGDDTIDAANGRRERVDCGGGLHDFARADRSDRLLRCERTRRVRRR